MLDHLTLPVRDLATSRAFYEKVLAPLGYSVIMEFPGGIGFGRDRKPSFWIGDRRPSFFREEHRAGASPIHVAFVAKDRAAVDAFHAAALEAGGTDFGAPGLRPQYHPGYYGAFVLDPDGNDVEAVVHEFG